MELFKSKRIFFLIAALILQSCEYLFPSLPGDKVTVEQAYNYIKKHQGDEDLVLLDVRTKEEYNKVHLQNSVLMDYKLPNFPAEVEKLNKDKIYLIYSGDDYRSANAFELMKELRFKNIHYITGGIHEWQKQGFPLN